MIKWHSYDCQQWQILNKSGSGCFALAESPRGVYYWHLDGVSDDSAYGGAKIVECNCDLAQIESQKKKEINCYWKMRLQAN